MAVIHDVMPAFLLLQPGSLADARKLLEHQGSDAWILAGGLDSFDWLKDRMRKPKAVIDLSGVQELKGVRTTSDGIEIGAMTTLTDVANHPLIQQKYRVLAEAAEAVASPQIRNQATIGGNVSQDARCWYYRAGWPCYRAGGNICYADTPDGRNREHAILHAERCVAVNPSDTAPALIALDARFVLQTAKGERVISAEDYFVGPDIDITRLTILRPGDLLSSIRIPAAWAGAQFYFVDALHERMQPRFFDEQQRLQRDNRAGDAVIADPGQQTSGQHDQRGHLSRGVHIAPACRGIGDRDDDDRSGEQGSGCGLHTEDP